VYIIIKEMFKKAQHLYHANTIYNLCSMIY
jgi:hypothetical protein